MSTHNLLQSILDANETYAAAFAQADPRLLKKLAKGQSPRIFWLGCSDSRVSAELSTGVAPGSIFVHRNIAQCFHDGDPSASAALTYAINVLKVEAIIVCGHTGCGGVKAAAAMAAAENKNGPAAPKNEHERIVTSWIKPLKDLALNQINENSKEGAYDPESSEAVATLTDKHVAETVKAVANSQIVKDAWANGQDLSVHGWVYHVGTAKLRDLDVGWKGDGVRADSLSRGRSYEDSEYSEHLDGVESDEDK
ncbi:hypothetical protein OIO90_001392 [Microbotryomycetes sp. JL221]|nr:hypothetical protein OIO90_001392 [Microbotryomycetes sp. JL221]